MLNCAQRMLNALTVDCYELDFTVHVYTAHCSVHTNISLLTRALKANILFIINCLLAASLK